MDVTETGWEQSSRAERDRQPDNTAGRRPLGTARGKQRRRRHLREAADAGQPYTVCHGWDAAHAGGCRVEQVIGDPDG